MEKFWVVKVRRQVIEQERKFEQVCAPVSDRRESWSGYWF
jgi:hypothetical protein